MSERLALPPFPRGWYAVALSDEVPVGGVLTRKYFGRELVIFRADSGDELVDWLLERLGSLRLRG